MNFVQVLRERTGLNSNQFVTRYLKGVTPATYSRWEENENISAISWYKLSKVYGIDYKMISSLYNDVRLAQTIEIGELNVVDKDYTVIKECDYNSYSKNSTLKNFSPYDLIKEAERLGKNADEMFVETTQIKEIKVNASINRELMKNIRKLNRLNIQKIDEALNYGYRSVELGRTHYPRVSKLLSISTLFGVPVELLFKNVSCTNRKILKLIKENQYRVVEYSFLPDKLEQLRKEKELSLTYVAAVIGTSGSSYSLYEGGKEFPLRAYIALCKLFDVNMDYFYVGTEKGRIDVNKTSDDVDALAIKIEKGNVKKQKAKIEEIPNGYIFNASKLVQLRKQLNLSQVQLNEKLNRKISVSAIRKYEQAALQPKMNAVRILADYFNLSPDELLIEKRTTKKAVI